MGNKVLNDIVDVIHVTIIYVSSFLNRTLVSSLDDIDKVETKIRNLLVNL